MDPKWLKHQIEELQNHLADFREIKNNSEASYRRLLELITDPRQKSSLMEGHLLNRDRQEKSIAKLEQMYAEAINQLKHWEKSNL